MTLRTLVARAREPRSRVSAARDRAALAAQPLGQDPSAAFRAAGPPDRSFGTLCSYAPFARRMSNVKRGCSPKGRFGGLAHFVGIARRPGDALLGLGWVGTASDISAVRGLMMNRCAVAGSAGVPVSSVLQRPTICAERGGDRAGGRNHRARAAPLIRAASDRHLPIMGGERATIMIRIAPKDERIAARGRRRIRRLIAALNRTASVADRHDPVAIFTCANSCPSRRPAPLSSALEQSVVARPPRAADRGRCERIRLGSGDIDFVREAGVSDSRRIRCTIRARFARRLRARTSAAHLVRVPVGKHIQPPRGNAIVLRSDRRSCTRSR